MKKYLIGRYIEESKNDSIVSKKSGDNAVEKQAKIYRQAPICV